MTLLCSREAVVGDTVARRITASRFVTCDRYLCERLVRVAFKVEVQMERDLVEIIRVRLCRAQYHCKLVAVCTGRPEGCAIFFQSRPRHFLNLFFLLFPLLNVLFLSTFLALYSFLFILSLIRILFEVSSEESFQFVISCFRLNVHEIRSLLGCYAAYSGNSVPTFRAKLSVLSLSVKKFILLGLSEPRN